MELIVGALDKHDLSKIVRGLSRFGLVLFNKEINSLAIELLQKYALSHGLALPDCLIAATAMVTNLELYTYNKKDYKFIEGLMLFK